MMPARRAVSSGSPFFMPPARICFIAEAEIAMRPRATASRAVAGFALTSTMRMRPRASRCDNFLAICFAQNKKKGQAFERYRQVHVFQLHAPRHLECSRRGIEDCLHARGDDDVDRGLGVGGGDGDDGDPDDLALRDLLEVLDVVNEDAAARPAADLVLQRVEQRHDFEAVVPAAPGVGKGGPESAGADDGDADAAVQTENLPEVPPQLLDVV